MFAVIAACSQRTTPAEPADSAARSAPQGAETTAAVSSSVGSPASSGSDTPRLGAAPQIATETDGTHIEYHTYGHGEPAVMLIHGWATDANYWNAQLQPLQARYTVVTLDLAGHGASTRNRSDWSMPAYGEDVAVVASQLTNRQIVLVGHAMGATVALEASSRIGARVIGIIGVDALKSIGLPPLPAADINARVAPFRTDFIGRTRSYVTESLFPRDANSAFTQKVAYDMSLEPAEVAIPSLQSLLAVDLNPLLRAIHVPLLAINSDMEATDVARIRRVVPDFKVDVIPHSSHFLMMDDAARFNPLLLKDIALLQQRAGSAH